MIHTIYRQNQNQWQGDLPVNVKIQISNVVYLVYTIF